MMTEQCFRSEIQPAARLRHLPDVVCFFFFFRIFAMSAVIYLD